MTDNNTQYRVWAEVHSDESAGQPRNIWRAVSTPFARAADAERWANKLCLVYRVEDEDVD